MSNYLIHWELDEAHLGEDPKERAATWKVSNDMLRQAMKEGSLKDFGSFAGEHRGFAVFEGSDLELGLFTQQFVPMVRFETHDFSRIDVVDKLIEKMLK